MRNKTVETLLEDQGYSLDESLKLALRGIPETVSKTAVQTIFKNVTGLYQSAANILKKNPRQIRSIVSFLCEYIESTDVCDFKNVVELFRDFEKMNAQAEQESIQNRKVEEQKKIAEEQQARERQALASKLSALNEKYQILEVSINIDDKLLYERFIKAEDVASAEALLSKLEILKFRQNKLKEDLSGLKSFLINDEIKIILVALKKGSSSDLEKAETMVETLEGRKNAWKEENEGAFQGIKADYCRLFPGEEILSKEEEFKNSIKNNDKDKVASLLDHLNQKNTAERSRLETESAIKGYQLQIEGTLFLALDARFSDLNGEIETLLTHPGSDKNEYLNAIKVNLNALKADISNAEKELRDVTQLPHTQEAYADRLLEIEKQKNKFEATFKQISQTFDTQLRENFAVKKQGAEKTFKFRLKDLDKTSVGDREIIRQDQAKLASIQIETSDSRKKVIENTKKVENLLRSCEQRFCFQSINTIAKALIEDTKLRIQKYEGTLFEKTVNKKEQAQGILQTLERLSGLTANGEKGRTQIGKELEALKAQKDQFTATSSHVGFWGRMFKRSQGYTINDQTYNLNMETRLKEIEESLNKALGMPVL